jgi:uracil-DNA glycosylase
VIDFRADIERQLEPFAAHIAGDVLASLLAIKGRPGAAERAGGAPFSGADGLALDKAFGSLGWGFGSQDTRRWAGLLLTVAGSPAPPAATLPTAESCAATLPAATLRLICELIDPLAIVALDEEARTALIDAFSSTEEGFLAEFTPGTETRVLGRQLISVTGFEDALASEDAKQKVWAQLKRCRPPQA